MLNVSNNLKFLIAICKDKPNDPIDICYRLYFINNTEENVNSLRIFTETNEVESEEFSPSAYFEEYSELKPKSILELKYFDEMDLGIHMLYDAYINTNKFSVKKKINLNDIFDNSELECEDIPLINKSGYVLCC